MKASVIIPAYNAASEIERAILSVCHPEPDFPYEILVVDDGSRDETFSVLENLQMRVPALRVIRQENAGPAAARNRGMREAKGEYLLFLDSDDAFAEGGFSRSIHAMEESGAELLIFGFSLVQGERKSPYRYGDASLLTPEDYGAHLGPLYSSNLLNQVWGKVFRRDVICGEGLLFPDEMWGEDRLFLFSVLEKVNFVRVIPDVLYEYIQKEGSLISRFLPEKPALCQRIHVGIRSLARKKGVPEGAGEAHWNYMYLKSLFSCLSGLFSPTCPYGLREKRSYVKEILSQKEISEANEFPSAAGRAFTLLSVVLKSGCVTANLAAAWGVHTASRILPDLVRKAKHAYNK